MQLKIGKKDYDINLGIRALKYLDDVYYYEEEQSGFRFGVGIELLTTGLSMGNILAVVNFIKAGTITERSKPSDEDIEEFIGSMTEDEFDSFLEEVKEELKKQPLTRTKARQILGDVEKATKPTKK